MAVESKPLFHPEVLRQQVRSFYLPEQTVAWQPKLQDWADLIASGRADEFKESALLPDFLTDIFCGLLDYTGPVGPADTHNSHNSHNSHLPTTVPAASPDTFTFSRERFVEVDGKFADAVLGRFQQDKAQFIAVLEGKGNRTQPIERLSLECTLSESNQSNQSEHTTPNSIQSMSELTIEFPGCQNCGIPLQRARGSIAQHPNHGAAVVTCYHGPIYERSRCACTPQPGLVSANGAPLTVLETIQQRDVAWLSIEPVTGNPREISANRAIVGDRLTVVLEGGAVQAEVRALTGRDDPQTAPFELDLNTIFQEGDSGSPVLNNQGQVIAVVRNTAGRCGFLL
jgi:hypothetical protein